MPAVATASLPVLCVTGADWKTNKKNNTNSNSNSDSDSNGSNYTQRSQIRVVKSNFGHFRQVVSKDVEFIKSKVSRGLEWANEAFQVPKISKTIDDFVWMRPLEDASAPPFQFPSWPVPCYPGRCVFMCVLINVCV